MSDDSVATNPARFELDLIALEITGGRNNAFVARSTIASTSQSTVSPRLSR